MWSLTHLALPIFEGCKLRDLTSDALLVLSQGEDQKRTVCVCLLLH